MNVQDSYLSHAAATLILSASPDSELLNRRAKMLNDAGYYTSSARTMEEAIQHAGSMNCTVAIICYSFAGAERKELAQRLRTMSPETTIVCLDHDVDKNQNTLIARIEKALARLTA